MQVACVQIAHFMRTLFFARIAVHISKGLSDFYIFTFLTKIIYYHKFNLAPSNSTNIHFTSSLISIAMKMLDK